MSLQITFTEGEWFGVLPDGTAARIASLLDAGESEESVASAWVATIGAPRTATYGSERKNSPDIYDNLKKEFLQFICGSDDKYDDDRKGVEKIWRDQGKPGLVLALAAILASTVHIAAAAIVPVIALLCSVVGKIGKGAFCSTYAADRPLDPAPPAS